MLLFFSSNEGDQSGRGPFGAECIQKEARLRSGHIRGLSGGEHGCGLVCVSPVLTVYYLCISLTPEVRLVSNVLCSFSLSICLRLTSVIECVCLSSQGIQPGFPK